MRNTSRKTLIFEGSVTLSKVLKFWNCSKTVTKTWEQEAFYYPLKLLWATFLKIRCGAQMFEKTWKNHKFHHFCNKQKIGIFWKFRNTQNSENALKGTIWKFLVFRCYMYKNDKFWLWLKDVIHILLDFSY